MDYTTMMFLEVKEMKTRIMFLEKSLELKDEKIKQLEKELDTYKEKRNKEYY